jgi:hypothetical protein
MTASASGPEAIYPVLTTYADEESSVAIKWRQQQQWCIPRGFRRATRTHTHVNGTCVASGAVDNLRVPPLPPYTSAILHIMFCNSIVKLNTISVRIFHTIRGCAVYVGLLWSANFCDSRKQKFHIYYRSARVCHYTHYCRVLSEGV